MQPYRDTGLSGIKSPDPALDYSLLREKIQSRSPWTNLLFYFINICTPVLDVEDPLASSNEEVEMTTPGQPTTAPAARHPPEVNFTAPGPPPRAPAPLLLTTAVVPDSPPPA